MEIGRRHVVLSRAILLACCACLFASDSSVGRKSGQFRLDGFPGSTRQASADRHPSVANHYHLSLQAGLPGQPDERTDSTPRRLQNLPAPGEQTPLRDRRFTHLTSDDGLSNIRINSILQDRRGFMWIATEDGLNRYDGNTFVVYKNNPADPNTVSASFIMSLIEDDHGYLWIGTLGGGLDKFDPTTERFTHYRYNPDNPNSISGDEVKSLARDSRGYLWLGTVDAGLNSFDPATGTFTRYRNDSQGQFVGAINSILEDRRREIWFAGPRGLFHVSPQTGQITRQQATIDRLGVDHVHEDKAGNLWMLAYSPGALLVKYDRQTERFTAYPFGKSAVGIPFSNILEDGQNGLWVASSLGLFRFSLQTEQFTDRFQHDESNPDSLNDSSVSFIYRDRAGVLWVGTQTWGLNLFNARQEQFGSYRHRPGNPASLSPGAVTALHQDRDGILWAGLLPRALDRLDRKTGQIAHYLPGSGNQNALGKGSNLVGIYRDKQGYLWLGGWGVLDRFDEQSGQFKHYRHKPGDPNSLISDEINCVYEDRSGRLWVGQNGGLSRLDPATEKFTNYRNHPADPASPGISNVSAIYQDRSGTLWLGTWTGTLSEFYDKTNTFVNLQSDARERRRLSGGRIQAIHEDRAGTLWLGTTDGLYRYNRENQTFTHYTENQGLPSAAIQCILDDRFGRLWLSTKKGISRFDPQTGGFRNYDASDGLQSNDFALNSCYGDGPGGEMLFGGSNGITAFFPQNIHDNPYVPPVVLTNFKVFNKPVPIGPKAALKKAIPFVDSLTLPYYDNVFSLEFAALSYANSQKNRYRYKLENFDRGWNEVDSKQRLATYTNLDPGKYVFHVQGSNSDGVWNEEGASLTIVITPPWWGTNWFRVFCVIVAVTLLYVVYQFRIRQLRREFALALEARVGERTRIARGLHDTLLQRFHGVPLRLQTVLQLIRERPTEAHEKLVNTIDQVADAISEARDEVQGLRDSTVQRNDLARAISTLGEELTNDPIAPPPALRVALEGEARDLHPLLRNEIYRIAAEAMRNAFRHAHARKVEVDIHYDNEQFRLRVRDDGKGIDPLILSHQGTEGHYGLPGMRERATLIGGKLTVWSEVDAGTEVELWVPAATAYTTNGSASWWSRMLFGKPKA